MRPLIGKIYLGMREAAAAIGIDLRTHRYWMQKDAVYVEAFQRAEAVVADRIEDEMFRRGVEGVERGVWYNGVQVGTERHYSDTLLIFAAKGAMPEKYRDRVDTTDHVSPTLAALMEQWKALRDAPQPPVRALPESSDEVEAEPAHAPAPLRRLLFAPGDTWRMLDAANLMINEPHDEDDQAGAADVSPGRRLAIMAV
jgi:hypothetical protein